MKLPPSALLAVAAALATVAAPAMAQVSARAARQVTEGFTCCNLHYEGDWISDANWSAMPMIPAGTPARITEVWPRGWRALVVIDGKLLRIGLDYGRKQQTLRQFLAKVIVARDPAATIAAWPADMRDAVRAGKIRLGMTRQQVIVAVGYPAMHQTPSLDAPMWRYWHTGQGDYLVKWNDAGVVADVIASPVTRVSVVHE
jgi:hypothetical protein